MHRKSLNPFNVGAANIRGRSSIGGSTPRVQNAAESTADNSNFPMAASRIYASPSMQNYDSSDPRYMGKSDNVENIYLPAPEPQKPRSGLMQVLNFIFTGEMR